MAKPVTTADHGRPVAKKGERGAISDNRTILKMVKMATTTATEKSATARGDFCLSLLIHQL
jgi:hypothetical protein